MCLSTITKKYETPDPTERPAWKLFNAYESGALYTPYTCHPIKRDVWHKAERVFNSPYPCGYHVFLTQEDAEKARKLNGFPNDVIVEVKVRNILCEGIDGTGIGVTQAEIKNLVADEMYVPSQPDQDKEPR